MALRGALVLVASIASMVLGCALPKGTGGDDAGAASGSTGVGVEAGAGATGAGCGQDPQTGITLCAALSLCPNLVVDNDLYPDCGFRVRGQTIDLECLCNGALCPIGIASTCAQAKQLLDGQNGTTVCAQINEGRCTNATPAPAASGGTSGSGSSCDKQCASECAGDPGCIRICGC